MISRLAEKDIEKLLRNFPVVGILGPRQCGKSTLAKQILSKRKNAVYLDMERASDLAKLNDAETYLGSLKGKLVCIDEIQRKSELFPLIRSLVDDWDHNGNFLVLGSASRDLLRQTSETLAGRIVYKNLTPFLSAEILNNSSFETYCSRGGFPRSILASGNEMSMEWRESFITTFLERDIVQWKNCSPALMGRLWQMLAHNNGQTINYSMLGNSLGVTSATVKNYIDLLESTFMILVLRPYLSNSDKRLVKAPKVYVADSGITTGLLNLTNYSRLLGHPVWGSVWEQIVLLNLKAHFPKVEYSYYRTSHGAELDIVVQHGETIIAVECKASVAPALTKGNYIAIEDLSPVKTFVAAPVTIGWRMNPNIDVVNIAGLVKNIGKIISKL
jgi:predicted AAA+ superfamily ATPase